MSARAVLLIAHGTVDALADLPAFLANIRRGHAAPPELVAEVTRRYQAIGGQSPLNAINGEVAAKLEKKLGVPVRLSNRLWEPYPKAVLAQLAQEGARRVAVVPLAQHSAYVYAEAAKRAAGELEAEGGAHLDLACAENWGQREELTQAYAQRIRAVRRDGDALVMTAHSLPKPIVDAGDPYEREVRASAAAIAKALGDAPYEVEFQSQGMSTGPGGKADGTSEAPPRRGQHLVEWLGRGIRPLLEACAARGAKRVVIAPIGFLADHVEILYDLDIEAKSWATDLGLTLARTESLNAADDFIDVLARVSAPLIGAS